MAQTKGNLQELPIKHYVISDSEVKQYLRDQLGGIAFDADFALWDNRAEWEKPAACEKCYVIMRAVFDPRDICVTNAKKDFVTTVLESMSADMQFREDVMNALKPFMFPKNMANTKFMPDQLARLASMGITGNRLEELMRRPGLFYDQVNKRFGLYLRPERIIEDMVRDPATNALDGTMSFGYVVSADNGGFIRWGVNVYHSKVAKSGVSIDSVFNAPKL